MPTRRSRSTDASMVARFSDEVKNQRGYWSRIDRAGRLLERLERIGEPRPHVVGELVRQVLGVDPRLGRELCRQGLAEVLGQALRLRRLAGHQRMRLDVEREVRRRALDHSSAVRRAGRA
jgi:hypothetical protein